MSYHIDVLPGDIDKNTPHMFDKSGVIKTKIPYTQEYHYHATSIASYVIKTGDESNLKWLMDNMDEDGSIHHDFVFPFYNMEKNWVGGLAQGLMASALALKGEEELAVKACESIDKYCLKRYRICEYPDVEILNGWIYALFGLYDAKYDKLFKLSCSELECSLKHYDVGYWSLYDQCDKFPATRFYHDIHVKQLFVLYGLTQNNQFLRYYSLFKSYKTKSNERRANLIKYFMVLKKNNVRIISKMNQRRRWLNG